MEENSVNNIYSEPIRDVIHAEPSWMLRWGILAVFFFVLTLIGAAGFIEYPEAVHARAIFQTANPPIPIISKSGGYLEFFISNGEKVVAGQTVGLIQNPARYADVVRMKNAILKNDDLLNVDSISKLTLGEIQSDYNAWLESKRILLTTVEGRGVEQRMNRIHKQLLHYQNISRSAQQSLSLKKRECKLLAAKFKRDSTLYTQNVIALEGYEESLARFLTKNMELENLRLTLLNYDLRMDELDQDLKLLQVDQLEDRQNIQVRAFTATEKLLNSIETWEKRYLLTAPIDGTVSFYDFHSMHQYVNSGTEVVSVLPSTEELIIGRAKIPSFNAGEVKHNQLVIVKIDNYPYREYGSLVGRVQLISPVPRDGFYMVEIGLPKGLETTYHKTIPFMNNFNCSVEIITKKQSLLTRVLYNLKDILVSKTEEVAGN
jgi:hypothetical protein